MFPRPRGGKPRPQLAHKRPAADCRGGSAGNSRPTMNETAIKSNLEAERHRLERLHEALLATAPSPGRAPAEPSLYDLHPADAGTEAFERSKEIALLEHVTSQIAEIEEAERRLDEGTYGVCETCGRRIAPVRLEVLPATRYCVEHQASAERRARAGRSTSQVAGL